MPRFNRMGPFGHGPGTGWGRGPCMGRGFRGGMGPRRGCGWGYGPFMPEITKKEEKEMLTEELEVLKEEMKSIGERLKELETKKKK